MRYLTSLAAAALAVFMTAGASAFTPAGNDLDSSPFLLIFT